MNLRGITLHISIILIYLGECRNWLCRPQHIPAQDETFLRCQRSLDLLEAVTASGTPIYERADVQRAAKDRIRRATQKRIRFRRHTAGQHAGGRASVENRIYLSFVLDWVLGRFLKYFLGEGSCEIACFRGAKCHLDGLQLTVRDAR